VEKSHLISFGGKASLRKLGKQGARGLEKQSIQPILTRSVKAFKKVVKIVHGQIYRFAQRRARNDQSNRHALLHFAIDPPRRRAV
jgi:hypothetical protein